MWKGWLLFCFYLLNTREFAFKPGNRIQRIQRENCSLESNHYERAELLLKINSLSKLVQFILQDTRKMYRYYSVSVEHPWEIMKEKRSSKKWRIPLSLFLYCIMDWIFESIDKWIWCKQIFYCKILLVWITQYVLFMHSLQNIFPIFQIYHKTFIS